MSKYLILSFLLIGFFLSFKQEKSKQDLVDFIKSDTTNNLVYSDNFDCKNFSETLVSNAKQEGFEAFTVWVAMRTNGAVTYHVFVGFNVNGEVVWIEPQNDTQYVFSGIGESLCYTTGECVSDELLFIGIN